MFNMIIAGFPFVSPNTMPSQYRQHSFMFNMPLRMMEQEDIVAQVTKQQASHRLLAQMLGT